MKTFYRFFTDSPVEFAKGKLLKGVEIFKAGIYRGKKYTKTDLQKMVDNFNLLKKKNIFPNVPVRVDHTNLASGLAGYVEKLRVKGKKLIADLDITEESIYKKIKKTTLRSRSVEVGTYEDNKGNDYFPVIIGVAWVDIPQVEGLAPVFAYGKDTKIINLNNPKDMKPKKEELNKDEKNKEEDEKDETMKKSKGKKDKEEEKDEDEKNEDDKSEEIEDEKDEDKEEDKSDEKDEGKGENEEADDEDEDEEEEEKSEEEDKDEEDEEDENEEEKTPDEEVDDLVKEIDEKIEKGEEGAFVDETDLSKRINSVVKMANKITVGRAKKLITSLQSVAKNLIDSDKYYSASRISELLSSLETILGSDSLSKKINSTKWNKKLIDSLPDSSFAVIEPAYLGGKTDDKNTRHLPYKDADGKVSLIHLRKALTDVDQITPITDSISVDNLKNEAKVKLTKIAKRYLKTTKYAKTFSQEKTGDFVKLRRKDYNQLIRDSEQVEDLQKTVETTVLEKRTSQINVYRKEGKSTPAMAEIEKNLVASFNDDQMVLYESLKTEQPKIVKFNDGQIKQDSEKPDGKSTSKKESDELASDFIKRTNPAIPESEQDNKKEKKDKSEDENDE